MPLDPPDPPGVAQTSVCKKIVLTDCGAGLGRQEQPLMHPDEMLHPAAAVDRVGNSNTGDHFLAKYDFNLELGHM